MSARNNHSGTQFNQVYPQLDTVPFSWRTPSLNNKSGVHSVYSYSFIVSVLLSENNGSHKEMNLMYC